MRPVLDTTVDEASVMAATTSNHTIETIPQGYTTIFVVVMGHGKRLTHLASDSWHVQVVLGTTRGVTLSLGIMCTQCDDRVQRAIQTHPVARNNNTRRMKLSPAK